MNSLNIHNINQKNVTSHHLGHRQTAIRAGHKILKVHRCFLDKKQHLGKTNKKVSPFSLFSHSPTLSNPFKITSIVPSETLDKISNIGSKQHAENPLQDFIRSLSVQPKNHNASVDKAEEKAIVSSQFSAEILEVIEENKDFKTLRIKRPKDWNFIPGQYLEIRSENSGAIKPAILAIASSIKDDYIEITGKANSDPNHAHYCLNGRVGERLIITGPLGSNFPLNLITNDTPVYVLGGGSGLTALKSVMDSLSENAKVKMIYSSKTSQEMFYKKKVEQWRSLGHTISFTQDQVEGYAKGRITDHFKKERFAKNALFFICGPKELVLETTKILVGLGVPRESIYGSLPATAKDGGPIYRGDHPKMMAALV